MDRVDGHESVMMLPASWYLTKSPGLGRYPRFDGLGVHPIRQNYRHTCVVPFAKTNTASPQQCGFDDQAGAEAEDHQREFRTVAAEPLGDEQHGGRGHVPVVAQYAA